MEGRTILLLFGLVATLLFGSHYQMEGTESRVLEAARSDLFSAALTSLESSVNDNAQNELEKSSSSQNAENVSDALPDDHSVKAAPTAVVSHELESPLMNNAQNEESKLPTPKDENISHVSSEDHNAKATHTALVNLTVAMTGVETLPATDSATKEGELSSTPTNEKSFSGVSLREYVEPHSSCGWNTSETATWTNNTKEENDLFWDVMACHRRLFRKKKEQWDQSRRPPPSSLRCEDNIMEDFQSIVAHYDKIAIFGDSIHRQLFFTLSCMLNSSLTKSDIESNGLFDWTYEPTNTLITFRMSPSSLHTYGRFENITTVDSSPRHAAITNLGAHYHPNSVDKLKSHARAIAEAAENTTTNVFWMESVDFQWPTTNGEFVFKCFECRCEALTPDRILGIGEFTGPERYTKSDKYPKVNASTSIPANYSGTCIPYCWPANWRNHVTNSVLDSPEYSAIKLVPIWQQLVSSGYAQSRFITGDCTHKSTDALLAMVQQLLRALRKQIKS